MKILYIIMRLNFRDKMNIMYSCLFRYGCNHKKDGIQAYSETAKHHDNHKIS